jgi:hypothetical protein
MSEAGKPPDPWQKNLLRSFDKRILLLMSRQIGKSLVASALALREALLRPDSLVLILSASGRQSGELYRAKLMPLYNRLGRPVPKANPRDNALRLHLANGSRIEALPTSEDTIVGFSDVRLLIIDEAARVPDSLYNEVLPMLAVSRGTLLALSTPLGKRGWFYDEWVGDDPDWVRVRKTVYDCPRITPEFVAKEKARRGGRWFRQNFECSFEECEDAVFRTEDIAAACADDAAPLFG